MYHISCHILWGYSLKNGSRNKPNIYGIGSSNALSVPNVGLFSVTNWIWDRNGNGIPSGKPIYKKRWKIMGCIMI